MISKIIPFNAVNSFYSGFKEALTPLAWNGKSITVMMQWGLIGMTAIAVVGTIFGSVMMNAPFALGSALFIPLSLVGSYCIRKNFLKEGPKIVDQKIQEIKEVAHAAVEEVKKQDDIVHVHVTENEKLKEEVKDAKEALIDKINQFLKELEEQKPQNDESRELLRTLTEACSKLIETLPDLTENLQQSIDEMRLFKKQMEELATQIVELKSNLQMIQEQQVKIQDLLSKMNECLPDFVQKLSASSQHYFEAYQKRQEMHQEFLDAKEDLVKGLARFEKLFVETEKERANMLAEQRHLEEAQAEFMLKSKEYKGLSQPSKVSTTPIAVAVA